jgi:hypothetical protein
MAIIPAWMSFEGNESWENYLKRRCNFIKKMSSYFGEEKTEDHNLDLSNPHSEAP